MPAQLLATSSLSHSDLRSWNRDSLEEPTWNSPVNNPHRSALLASASEKLAEATRRIEQLQARLASLTVSGPNPLT